MEHWIWLRLVEGIGSITERKLLEHFGSPKNIYEADQRQLREVEGIGPKLASNICGNRSLEQAQRLYNSVQKQGIKIVTIHESEYPQQLMQYSNAPTLLYYKGTIRNNRNGVAIVGARRCSSYGKQVALDASSYLARYSIPVISGLAKGIDSYAHTACIKANGYTIAVVAHGLDQCYPKEHQELMQAIIETGAVISEYPPGTRPRPEYFPKRNALIAGLSSKVLIAEAALKSGALLTAAYAKEQGKECFAAPHEIYSASGKGCNQLLIEGARMYLQPKQLTDGIEKSIELNATLRTLSKNQLTGNEKKISDCLVQYPKTIEDIERETGIKQIELLGILSVMEIEGYIQATSGGRFSKINALQR